MAIDYSAPVVTWGGINRIYAQIEMDRTTLSLSEATQLRDRLTYLLDLQPPDCH